jgi:hypothetical protein
MSDPVLDQPDIAIYNRGYQMYRSGSKAKGLPLITQAAHAGQPHAISTLIWVNVVDDQIKEALDNYEKCTKPAHAWIEAESRRLATVRGLRADDRSQIIDSYKYQISNFKSNAALAFLADKQEATALKMWAEAAKDHGHIESRFYPIFHQKKNDPTAVMTHLSQNFHPEELKALITELSDVSKESTGWFRDWSIQSLGVLRKVDLKAMAGTAAFAGAWMASRAYNNYIEEQNEENMEEAVDSFFNWMGDFFG